MNWIRWTGVGEDPADFAWKSISDFVRFVKKAPVAWGIFQCPLWRAEVWAEGVATPVRGSNSGVTQGLTSEFLRLFVKENAAFVSRQKNSPHRKGRRSRFQEGCEENATRFVGRPELQKWT